MSSPAASSSTAATVPVTDTLIYPTETDKIPYIIAQARVRDGRITHVLSERVLVISFFDATPAAVQEALYSMDDVSLEAPLDLPDVDKMRACAWTRMANGDANASGVRHGPQDKWLCCEQGTDTDTNTNQTRDTDPPNTVSTQIKPAETSKYLCGRITIVLNIVDGILKGGIFSNEERLGILSGVYGGSNWWKNQNPHANISYVYTYLDSTVTADPAPYVHGTTTKLMLEAPWRDQALEQQGFDKGLVGVGQMVTLYQKINKSAWSFAVFFSKYNLGHAAYASGQRVVMGPNYYDKDGVAQTNFAGWGWTSDVDRGFAHEMGHIFGAADEYGLSPAMASGTNPIFNGNCKQHCTAHNLTQSPCIMAPNSCGNIPLSQAPACRYTQGQVGWKFTDNFKCYSAPFAPGDNWVYYRGVKTGLDGHDRLLRVKIDGTNNDVIRGQLTSSSPFVYGDYVYYRGTNDYNYHIKCDGSADHVIAGDHTGSTPMYCSTNDYIYYRKPKDQLRRCRRDGKDDHQLQGDGESHYAPVPDNKPDGYIYYCDKAHGELKRVKKSDLKAAATTVNGVKCINSPFIADNNWVYYQGTDNQLRATNVNNPTSDNNVSLIRQNKTLSSPFVSRDNCVYFPSITLVRDINTQKSVEKHLATWAQVTFGSDDIIQTRGNHSPGFIECSSTPMCCTNTARDVFGKELYKHEVIYVQGNQNILWFQPKWPEKVTNY